MAKTRHKTRTHPPTYYLLTLGCPKNTVDSEAMAMLLQREGYRATGDPQQADVLIVNTCGFLEAAKEESIAALSELAAAKRPRQKLIAAGCLAQRDGREIIRRVPGVDGLLGTRRWMEVVPLVEQLRVGRRSERYALLGDPEQPFDDLFPRPVVVGGSAYLKISDGCNAPCAFCSIPLFKGKLRSRPLPAIVEEAAALVSSGARELILVAQDTTDYGRDLGEPDALPHLLSAICRRLPTLRWLRLMYAYPGHVNERLIEVMASEPQIVHYLDIPLQHAHPATLRRMRRPSNPDWMLKIVQKLRAAMPDIALRTTFMVGFPGESEEEFQTLLDFMAAVQFDRVGVFRFSPEPGTLAATMPDQIPEEVKEERWHRLMAHQQRISLARNQAQVGRTLDVLIEGSGQIDASSEAELSRHELTAGDGSGLAALPLRHDALVNLGRSYRDAPEIDGLVLVPGPRLAPGQMVRVHITGALTYDLIGELAPDATTAPSSLEAAAELSVVA